MFTPSLFVTPLVKGDSVYAHVGGKRRLKKRKRKLKEKSEREKSEKKQNKRRRRKEKVCLKCFIVVLSFYCNVPCNVTGTSHQ